MTVPEPLTGPVNELAKERTRAAAERTLSSWINNCLLLIGFGVAIDQLQDDLRRLLPSKSDWVTAQVAHTTSLIFIVLGIVLLIIVMGQHILILQFLARRRQVFNAELFLRLNQVTISAVLLFGGLSLLLILLRAS